MRTTRHISLLLLLLPIAILTLVSAGCGGKLAGSDGDTGIDGDQPDGDQIADGDTQSGEVVWPRTPSSWTARPEWHPTNIHLTWQRDPASTITANWRIETAAPESYLPRLWVVAESETRDAAGRELPFAVQYAVDGTCSAYEEELDLGKGHTNKAGDTFIACEAEMTGLRPATRYWYRVGTWEGFDFSEQVFVNPTLSEPEWFDTGLPAGDSRPFTFMLAGDSRGGYAGISANIERLVSYNPDFWFFNGDMNDTGSQLQWDTWFEVMAPILKNKVLMPVHGNHEMFANVYFEQFALPRETGLAPEWHEHGWTARYGNLFSLGLDANTEEAVIALKPWVEAQLTAADSDPAVTWKVVMFHYPAYSASSKHGSTQRVIDHWVPIFERHGVDLTFSGHDHDYERTKPIRAGQIDDSGVVHVVAGGFYSPGYGNGYDWWTEVSHHGDLSNYVIVTIDGNSLTGTAWSGDGTQKLDEFTLTK